MTTVSTTPLSEALNTELQLLTAFNEALEKETTILLERHNESLLNEISQVKTQYADELELTHQLRTSIVEELGFDHSVEGLLEAAKKEGCAELAEAVLVAALQAKQHNENNGLVIQTFLSHNREALDALLSFAQPNEQLYDAKGVNRQNKGAPQSTSIKA